jgi:hypothetical protein
MHDKTVSSVGFVIEGSFDVEKFNKWLQNFLKTKAVDVYRSKGIFSIMGSDERHVFQAVHMLMSFGTSGDVGTKLPPWGPDEPRTNKLCFIGRNLDRKELYDGLKGCLHDGKPVERGGPPKKKLRLKVGQKVKCNVGEWASGTIVQHWYREDYWETGRFAPYQVQVQQYAG